MSTRLQPGDKLHASCSDEIYADVIEAFEHHVTILVHDVNDLINHEDLDEMTNRCKEDPAYDAWRSDHCTRADKTPVIVREVYIEHFDDDVLDYQDYNWSRHSSDGIERRVVAKVGLDTPGNNCYRCTKYFSVLRAK